MKFFFELEDRFGVTTTIDDPIGWDNMTFILERDKGKKHGVFFAFQADPFIYDGEAGMILKTEYNAYGIEGEMYLRISYDCGTGFETLPKMRFVFESYEAIAGSECSVTLPVESLDEAVLLRNRVDQKVNLQTTLAFDGTTALPTYAALPFTKTLPAKSITVTNAANNNVDIAETYPGYWYNTPPAYADQTKGWRQVAFAVPGFVLKTSQEIGQFIVPTDTTVSRDEPMEGNTAGYWEPPPDDSWIHLPYWINDGANTWDNLFPFDSITPILNYDASLGSVYGVMTVTIEGRYNKRWDAYNNAGVTTSVMERAAVYLGILKGGHDQQYASSWQWLSPGTPTGGNAFNIYPYTLGGVAIGVGGDFTFSFNVQLRPGDRVYYFDKVAYRKKDSQNINPALTISNLNGSFIKISGLSKSPDTTCKLFMLNESFSRVCEAISNDKFRFYSDYLGRTDAQPTASATDGCGSYMAITQGLFIRRVELVRTTTPPLFSVSLNDLWTGANPILNLGLGIENDPNRPGFRRVRVEPWRFFYKTGNPALICAGVTDIQRKVVTAEHTSVFKFGFQKWEAEAFAGIDEYMTQREYRTHLTQTNQTLSQISSFVGSTFAIEVTRRKGNTTSEDWRYDQDIFVICMKRTAGVLNVQVGDITGAANITDPASILNFRIRPSVMALQWLPYVLKSYRQAGFGDTIIFTDGSGNVYATGLLTNSPCVIEGHAISEKEDLSPSDMANPNDGVPIDYPERVVYQHPLTVPEFFALLNNASNEIEFYNDQDGGFGWIDRVEYKVNDGLANFSLIPSR
jgi:hypothetical protein